MTFCLLSVFKEFKSSRILFLFYSKILSVPMSQFRVRFLEMLNSVSTAMPLKISFQL